MLIKKYNKKAGFTLIEILVVLGILAILATLVLVAVNPGKQFRMARDTKRAANVATILNAVSQNIADHGGIFTCAGTATFIPPTFSLISSEEDDFSLAPCVVPDYISALPVDPSMEGSYYTNEGDYQTNYKIKQDIQGRITIQATGEIPGDEISVTR